MYICSLCAKVVLNIKWQQLSDEDQSKQNFRKTVEATHGQLVHAGFDRFGLLLNIMENPWTDPTITKIMSGDPEDESNSDTEEDENEMSDERKKELEERKRKRQEECMYKYNPGDRERGRKRVCINIIQVLEKEARRGYV
jgi:hypothetical protein